MKVAVKAMQKGKIQDYESFKNEIEILKQLVTKYNFTHNRIIPISLSCSKLGRQIVSVSSSLSKI